MKPLAIAICATLCAGPSLADLRVTFVDGAPKDRFVITNEGSCDIGPSELTIDFGKTPAGLIFDVTAAGAGVEVFQPFEVTQGADLLTRLPTIADGDQTATLALAALGRGQKLAFTIDVDDTAGAREITVSGSEAEGTLISLTTDGARANATMDATGAAVLSPAACL
jgi:hypothetical protein